MQQLSAAIIAAAAFFLSPAAHAQMSGVQIASQCTAGGAFGQHFGQEMVGGDLAGETSQFIDLAASFAPFRHAEISITPNTRQVHTATGVAQFNNETDAREALHATIAALDADPRFATSIEGTLREGSKTYYSGEPFSDTGLAAEVWVENRELVYFCSDAALASRAFDERVAR